MSDSEWSRALATMPDTLARTGYVVSNIHAQVVDLTCEPDNMLSTQFAQEQGHMPIVESLYRVVVNGHSDRGLKELTQIVATALPSGTYWYGSSYEGPTEPGITAACAWQHRD